MALHHRGLLAAIVLAALTVAGCGGGGSGGGGPVSPPTAQPLVESRPLAAGDVFAYAGATTDVKHFANPAASSSTTSQVVQSVAVSGPTTFNGLTNAYDFETSETDTAPLQQIAFTTDTYYAEVPASTASFTNLVTSGYTSSDTLGERTTVALAAGNGLVDILPETGQSWTNDGAQTSVTDEADGTSEKRIYAADGSYQDTTTYPQGSQFTPQPAPLTATIVENSNGSGSYSLPLFGSQPNVTISFGTPNPAGQVPIVVAAAPKVLETANPVAFYSPAPKLYSETDSGSLGQTIPAGCKAAAAFGTVSNAIVETAERIDTVLGTIETLSQTSYVVPKYGVACVALTDITDSYYDYSGQSNVGLVGIAFNGGRTPTETDQITTTLGLTAATLQAMSLHERTTGATTAGTLATGLRLANARSNFLALVDRERLARKVSALARLRAVLQRAYPLSVPVNVPGGSK
jgi:hypothetical protein